MSTIHTMHVSAAICLSAALAIVGCDGGESASSTTDVQASTGTATPVSRTQVSKEVPGDQAASGGTTAQPNPATAPDPSTAKDPSPSSQATALDQKSPDADSRAAAKDMTEANLYRDPSQPDHELIARINDGSLVGKSATEVRELLLVAGPAETETDSQPAQAEPPGRPESPTRAPTAKTPLTAGPTTTRQAINSPFVTVAPKDLQLGQIATEDTGRGTVTLKNDGATAVKCDQPKTSCGCTSTGLKKGTVLNPGESVDVEIRLKAGTQPAKLNKSVTFNFLENTHPPVRMRVMGEAITYVAVTPDRLDPETAEEGRFVLKSTDETPFRITSMSPNIIEKFPEEKALEQEVVFDWSAWEERGRSRRLIFYTDHPKCARVYSSIIVRRQPKTRADAAAAARGAETPEERIKKIDEAERIRSRQATAYEAMIRGGRGNELMEKVKAGLAVDSRDASGSTLLGLAAKYDDIDLMKGLIESGADLEAPDRAGRTALMVSAQGKDLNSVRLLLDAGAALEAKDSIGGTALTWASTRGTAEIVQELIDQGAAVNVVGDLTGFTPLIWAAGFDGDPRSIAILVEAGANLESQDLFQGATPVMHAARTGKAAALRELLRFNPNIEHRERTGQTVFLAACGASGGTAEKIQMLIDAGVDLTAKDNQGNGALELARRRTDQSSLEVIALLEKTMGEK